MGSVLAADATKENGCRPLSAPSSLVPLPWCCARAARHAAAMFHLISVAAASAPASAAGGELLANVSCGAAALLVAERTALNLLQRLCGVATRTSEFVALAAGKARLLDTRKTTPGLRRLERHAVRCGGGENHRFGLADEVMIKDNHLDLSGRPLQEVVEAARAAVTGALRVTVEARDLEEAKAAICGGADVVMLDNIEPAEMSVMLEELRALVGDRAVEFEASGGVNLETIAAVAACGVDRVSVGALTHSAPAIDLALEVEL